MTGRAFRRSAAIFGHDVAMASVSFLLSLYLRLGNGIVSWPRQVVETGLVAFTLTAVAVLLVIRLDTAVWRYTSIGDLARIVRAVLLMLAGFLVVQFALTRLDDFPRSFLVIEAFVLTAMLAGPRFAYRLLKDGTMAALLERNAQDRIPVLLVGAGDGSELFIREMARGLEAPYRAVGIVDDRDARTGRQIRGVRVLGGLNELAAVVDRLTGQGLRQQRLVLTRARIDGATVRRVF